MFAINHRARLAVSDDSIGDDVSQVAQLRLARQVLAQLRESVVITDSDLDSPGPRIVWVNAAFTKMTGYTAEEVIGLTPRILHGPKTSRELMDRLRTQLAKGESFTGEGINYRKDGSEFNIDWYIEPLRGDMGEITHFVAVQRDTTVERQLEAQLIQAQRLESIGMLASGVSHDLNNMLSPILLGAELLSPNLSEDDRKILAIMQSGAERGASLVNQILAFARGVSHDSKVTQMKRLIDDVVSLASQTFPKRISTKGSVPEDLWPVIGDSTEIHQVLMNLCVNARDAIDGEGAITVSAENRELLESEATAKGELPHGRYVRICVTDTGSGIPDSVLEKIFDPFFTTKAPDRGTGLGLSTVLAIVKGHAGALNVTTTTGCGTTFSVDLPATLEASPGEGDLTALSWPSGHGQTLLVVDDEEAIVGIFKEILTASGYRVVTAQSGERAVEIFESERPAVTLLDLMMAGGGGADALRQMRAINPSARVIVLSGLSPEEAALDAPGADAFLAKPVSAADLLGAVARTLSC
jgi:PAS domain S-box-containing protein